MALITQATVDALQAAIDAAIADGTWRIKSAAFSDQAQTWLTIPEAMEGFLRDLEARVGAQGSGLTKYVQTSKGV